MKGLNEIPGIRCSEPAGAFYAFPNVTAITHDDRVKHDWVRQIYRAELDDDNLFTLTLDTSRFTRNMEIIYGRMWESWLRNERPKAFSL